jgi:hypothetical protein
MSSQNKFDQLQNDGFKPLSEEDERHISGGSAMKPGRCADDEYQDPISGLCVKKSNHPTPTTS